jgi:hypothetical protein
MWEMGDEGDAEGLSRLLDTPGAPFVGLHTCARGFSTFVQYILCSTYTPFHPGVISLATHHHQVTLQWNKPVYLLSKPLLLLLSCVLLGVLARGLARRLVRGPVCALTLCTHTTTHHALSPLSNTHLSTHPHCSSAQCHTPNTSTGTRPSCCTWHTAAPQPHRVL